MQLRLRTLADVRAFSIAITLIAVLGTLILQNLFMPADLAEQIRLSGAAITVCLMAPISFFLGLRLHEIFRQTLDLERSVHHDLLTGLLTRRALFQRVHALKDRAGVVIVADIDHFKSFNDQHGHATGDAALRYVAHCFQSHCRAEDLIARFGGEEFVIILPDIPIDSGLAVAQRLCKRLRHTPMSHDGLSLAVTASFGVSMMTSPDQIDDAISRADAALYEAKRAGRDQVCRDV